MKNIFVLALMFFIFIFVGCSGRNIDLTTFEPIQEDFSFTGSAQYRVISWRDLPNWKKDNHQEALESFKNSCAVMGNDPKWKKICDDALAQDPFDHVGARIFFETHFLPYEVIADGVKTDGVITGYYLPVLNGSRSKSQRFKYPVYARPNDLVVVQGQLFNRGGNFRGRVTDDYKVVPYYTREEIEVDPSPLAGSEIVWVDDDIALFFLHIQGSGFVRLPNGETVQLNYDDQNGHKYFAIGKRLIEDGKIAKENISLQTIRSYLLENPNEKRQILNSNPSYIFFKEGNISKGVVGTQGARLTNKRSVAVDRAFIELGTPIFVEFIHPVSNQPTSHLTVAQDTGGAIKGAIRADFFWGDDLFAEVNAGNMKGRGRVWVLLPKERL